MKQSISKFLVGLLFVVGVILLPAYADAKTVTYRGLWGEDYSTTVQLDRGIYNKTQTIGVNASSSNNRCDNETEHVKITGQIFGPGSDVAYSDAKVIIDQDVVGGNVIYTDSKYSLFSNVTFPVPSTLGDYYMKIDIVNSVPPFLNTITVTFNLPFTVVEPPVFIPPVECPMSIDDGSGNMLKVGLEDCCVKPGENVHFLMEYVPYGYDLNSITSDSPNIWWHVNYESLGNTWDRFMEGNLVADALNPGGYPGNWLGSGDITAPSTPGSYGIKVEFVTSTEGDYPGASESVMTSGINYTVSENDICDGSTDKCTVSTDTNYNTAPCSGICSNNYINYPTCTTGGVTCSDGIQNQDETGIDTGGVCGEVVLDSCGTYSGNTPKLSEPTTNPTACSPGTYLNSPSDITTSGSQAWKWSCGTVTSCTAPKYGCTVTTDTNYNSTGPDNDWACNETCKNGDTNYPTCTIPPVVKCTVTTDTNYNISACSGVCSNGDTNYPTCTIPPVTDSCGTSSGSTPKDPQPTGTDACSKGSYASTPADTTTSGLQAWNWSCGTVTNCTAPKYGCTVTTDTNYDANGPSNLYRCANTCKNGKTNYPTCDGGGGTPINGGWSGWSGQTCGTGTGTESQYCNNPLPANGGLECLKSDGTRDTREDISYTKVACSPSSCPNGAEKICPSACPNNPVCPTECGVKCPPSQKLNTSTNKCVNNMIEQES